MTIVSLPKLDPDLSPDTTISMFQANINTWEKRVQSLKQEKEREKPEDLNAVLEELDKLSVFLKGRLTKRLLGVKSFPDDLKKKYLRCLEPFYTEEGIARFLGHYFEVEVFKQVRLRYRKKKDFEKEVNVLFDLYKVKKTIETISTLEKSVHSDEAFASRFPKSEQAEFLKTLREIFKLFFLRFVKKEYRKQLYESLSESSLEMDEIIAMRKNGTSYINQEVFQTNEYREKFITVFFSTLLRTKTSTEIKDLHFNYLNFELLKNEFLTDWMQRKLKESSEKDKVLGNYQINGKSVAQIIKENPEKESEILSSIPLEAFNDIAEQVNEKVKDESKTPVSTFSKNHGLFARLESTFVKVRQIAKYSVEKMEEMRPATGIWTVKKKAGEEKKSLPSKIETLPSKKPAAKNAPEPKKELKVSYGLEVLKMDDLDFPFFDKNQPTYAPKLEYLKKRMASDYDKFRSIIWKLFNIVAREHFIIRRDPCHEWVLPFLFDHEGKRFLLFLGAEISLKDQKAGYQSRWAKSQYALNSYYLFASEKANDKFGKIIDKRQIRQSPFHQYSYGEKTTQKMMFSFLSRIIQSQNKETFKSSNLKFRKPEEPFEELSELRNLLGLDKKPDQNTGVEKEEDSISKSPDTVTNANQDNDKTSEVTDIRKVAENLKKEMEEARNKPAEVNDEKPKDNPNDINQVAAKLKQEMEEAKASKEQKALAGEVTAAPQKTKDIQQVASELKEELSQKQA
jgi:hypothetical protein